MVAIEEQKRAVYNIAKAFVEIVKEMGDAGAPAGPMFAAVAGRLELRTFNAIMDGLVTAKRLRKQGHVYYFVKDIQ